MSSVVGFVKRIYTMVYPPVASPTPDSIPIKFGILGAAAIAPPALINPALSHPEVVIYAVAARDRSRAEAFAKKYDIAKAYGGPAGYQELLDDPAVDAVYNPLPNGLHYEWTMKALAAGKHVLLEKPAANTAEETRAMFELAERKGLVLLEAFHYRFHPAIQRMKAILDSGELGKVKSITTRLDAPSGTVKTTDIRFIHALGGGALMDMGCYTLSCIRYLASANPTSVLVAEHVLQPSSAGPAVDRRTVATLALPADATATLTCDLGTPPRLGFVPRLPGVRARVECEGGSVDLFNFVLPTLYHTLTVRTRGSATRVEKVYTFRDGQKGEAWWTTYRFQLEAFVDKIKGRQPQTWVEKEDSVANMKWIEEIYAKTGLGSRPKSDFIPAAEN